MVGCVVSRFLYIGIITTTHHFAIDNNLLVEGDGHQSTLGYATHVTATVERSEVGGIVFIVVVEHNTGIQVQRTTIHILGEIGSNGHIYAVELLIGCTVRVRIIFERTVSLDLLLVEIQYVVGILVLLHVFAIVTKENLVSNNMRSNPQFHEWVFPGILQGSTVATYEDGTADDCGRNDPVCTFTLYLSFNADGHLLGIGTNHVQGLDGLFLSESLCFYIGI